MISSVSSDVLFVAAATVYCDVLSGVTAFAAATKLSPSGDVVCATKYEY